jgi:hypothetical protein
MIGKLDDENELLEEQIEMKRGAISAVSISTNLHHNWIGWESVPVPLFNPTLKYGLHEGEKCTSTVHKFQKWGWVEKCTSIFQKMGACGKVYKYSFPKMGAV